MSEVTTGARAVLSRAHTYDAFQRALGGNSSRRTFVREHLRVHAGDHVLDVGCGTGELLSVLPEVRYTGIDLNPAYIDAARKRFGARGTFVVGDLRDASAVPDAGFDVVVCTGVLHHLGDAEVDALLAAVSRVLRPEGRFVSLDAAWTVPQHSFAAWIIRRDRGKAVRLPGEYRALAQRHFVSVEMTVRTDLLRIPYTHVVLECARAGAPSRVG